MMNKQDNKQWHYQVSLMALKKARWDEYILLSLFPCFEHEQPLLSADDCAK